MAHFDATWLRIRLGVALVSLCAAAGPLSAASAGPWQNLLHLRQNLSRGEAQTWSFVQSFRAAGFQHSEKESGKVYLNLPHCLRWDYAQPYPKSYLLCDGLLHEWNPGEPLGHVIPLDASQPGLDLLLLDVDALSQRYEVTSQRASDGSTVLDLKPRKGKDRLLRHASLTTSSDEDRLLRLSYEDREGNFTEFDFTPEPTPTPRSMFAPPRDIEWERDTPNSQ